MMEEKRSPKIMIILSVIREVRKCDRERRRRKGRENQGK
jgi:hypothetical protein